MKFEKMAYRTVDETKVDQVLRQHVLTAHAASPVRHNEITLLFL